jgi:hypothetical protein
VNAVFQATVVVLAASVPLRSNEVFAPRRAKGGSVRTESRAAQEADLNWHGILGMMALMLVSFGLYGAAVGMYFTLTS